MQSTTAHGEGVWRHQEIKASGSQKVLRPMKTFTDRLASREPQVSFLSFHLSQVVQRSSRSVLIFMIIFADHETQVGHPLTYPGLFDPTQNLQYNNGFLPKFHANWVISHTLPWNSHSLFKFQTAKSLLHYVRSSHSSNFPKIHSNSTTWLEITCSKSNCCLVPSNCGLIIFLKTFHLGLISMISIEVEKSFQN